MKKENYFNILVHHVLVVFDWMVSELFFKLTMTRSTPQNYAQIICKEKKKIISGPTSN